MVFYFLPPNIYFIATSEKISEVFLVKQLREKNQKAFEYLYDHYNGALYGAIIRVVKDEDLAAEVLQDVFMKVWNKIGAYDESKGRLYTWMLNIGRNAAIDKVRSKEIKQSKKTDAVADNVYQIDRANSDEQKVETIGLKSVVNQLDEELQFVIEQMYFKGYTQSEISDEFNMPLGTVKTRARKAMQELRRLLS